MKLQVNNLPTSIESGEVETLFTPYGKVTDVKLIHDQPTGRIRGSLHMPEGAIKAIEALNKSEFKGNIIHVSVAKEKIQVTETTPVAKSASEEAIA